MVMRERMQVMSVDIEISNVFELKPGEDLDKYAPLHVAVAATAVHGGEERLWYSADDDENPRTKMSKGTAQDLLRYLVRQQQDGYVVCAWNGLGFDFRWLGHAAEDMKLAAKVALKSYDPMFQFFNQTGFPVSLAAVGEAMGIKQRKSMHAADAPKQWCSGNHRVVMDYVLGDCQITNETMRVIAERAEICWTTRNGVLRTEPVPKLKTVETVLSEPEPDQSWMDSPLRRAKFAHWLP